MRQRHRLNDPILTILVLLGDLASVVLFLFFLEGGGGVEQDGEVQDAYFLIEDLLVDLILALIRDQDAEICMESWVLLMMLMRS